MPDESMAKPPLRVIGELLEKHGVEYLVIGGQAETMMGSSRVTYDVDLCYSRTGENVARLAAALNELAVELRGVPTGLPFRADARTLQAGLNFTFESTAGPLDLLGEVEPLGTYDALSKHAEEYEIWGLRYRTISLDDLIRVKRHLGRPKDRESLLQLLAIKKLREQGGSR